MASFDPSDVNGYNLTALLLTLTPEAVAKAEWDSQNIYSRIKMRHLQVDFS